MAKWIYICKGGTELRNLISRAGTWEMSIEIIHQLQRCYEEIIDNYPWEDEYDRDEFQEIHECLNGDDGIIECWINGTEDIEEYGFDDDMDLVDARLEEFYNLCDSYRIWVEA